ncbi:TrmH family RNA methyltransferase [Pasteurella bettyae]|uniref:TrmH family RNA methyltransferase n=1 Tax=Pasteurella bettyae TaxID=752 RepID=UPI003D27F093
MNDKSSFQKTKFQQSSHQKRFNECSVDNRNEKPSQNRPQFGHNASRFERDDNHRSGGSFKERKGKFEGDGGQERQNFSKNDRTFSPRNARENERRNPRSPFLQPRVTETTMEKASGAGNVKVMVKSSSMTNVVPVKKTGPLSPRAPEKIKKNRSEEMKVYGEGACLALFAERPESIVRVWATVEMAHKVGDMFSYLATNKKVYHVVDREELELVSGTEHHGGICMLVKKARPFTLSGYLDIPREKDALVMLDNIRNPQNVGGIVRTCAFYGVKGVIIDDVEMLNSAAAMRVAEGGMEYIHTLQTDYLDNALNQLRKAGYQIIHTTTNKQAKGVHKLALAKKVVFVLSESDTSVLAQQNDEVINLSFANPLRTGLNVAVVAGVLLAEWVK